MKTIVLTGGGTAGHIMPNIYLLPQLKEHFDKIYYIGANGIEKQIAYKNKLEYLEISATKLRRGKILSNLLIPFKLVKSICLAKKILKKLKPNMVFSKGGFVSLPVCIAAKQLKIPVISHESDFSFGIANKIILKNCNIMFVNFEHLAKKSFKIKYSGPILSDDFEKKFVRDYAEFNLDKDKKTLLVLGGSIGSQKINENLRQFLPELTKKYNVVHHVGKGNLTKENLKNYFQFEFYDNMPKLYSLCNLVICRAGAGTVFECAYMQKPMLLIPLENRATRGDQLQNAQFFKNFNCAEILRENMLNKDAFHQAIEHALQNESQTVKNLQKLNIKNGKDIVVKEIISLTK